MAGQVERTEAGGAPEETIPCPTCGAAVPVAKAAGEDAVMCPSCGNRVPIGHEPTGGVRPS